jgi:hypothetical protein
VMRAEVGLSASSDSPWRSSLYELIGLADERLNDLDGALAAYMAADLPSTRIRAHKLRAQRR